MENTPGSRKPDNPRLGPLPTRTRAPQPALSKPRAALLEMLRGWPEPTALSALGAASGLHENTLREHLEGLIRQGLVRRFRARPIGRGRPAWLYQATADEEESGRSDYAGLAATLASAIHRGSDSPREDAILAGTEWGRELAQGANRPKSRKRSAAHRRVVQLLDEIGFAPTHDARGSVVRLTRCPLLEAAYKYPDVVCGVHLGIVRGALEEYGADPSGTDLYPFSEPGACRLELPAAGQPG